jgi:hypothetical protein
MALYVDRDGTLDALAADMLVSTALSEWTRKDFDSGAL